MVAYGAEMIRAFGLTGSLGTVGGWVAVDWGQRMSQISGPRCLSSMSRGAPGRVWLCQCSCRITPGMTASTEAEFFNSRPLLDQGRLIGRVARHQRQIRRVAATNQA